MNITNIKSTFGYIGFLPFAVFSLIPWIIGGEISKTLIVFQLGYGAIIITFLGGFAWGWRDDQKSEIKFINWHWIQFDWVFNSITYFFEDDPYFFIDFYNWFYSFYIFEKSTEDFNNKDIDYQKFRKILTLLVCISFLISAGYWINPYSNPYLQ